MQNHDRSTTLPDTLTSTLTDADIVESVRRGNVQAYGQLVERYERGVLASVLSIVRDLHAAQDVVQDVFVQSYVKLSRLRDASRFGFWLMKIARREALRAARRRKRLAVTSMQVTEVDVTGETTGDSSGNAALLDDEKSWLLARVRRLPAHERLIVGLRFFDGHGVKEIAQITGRPVGTITKQLSRALQRLRGELESEIRPCQTNPSSTN